MIKLTKGTKKVIEELKKAGFKAYIVGGCVRDYIMGLNPYDVDITTDAKPEEIKHVFFNYRIIDTGIKHGTVTVLIDNESFEITTFRIETTYSDNRHPDSVTYTGSLKEDLSRRDFTMNAIAYNEDDGFVDYFGGNSDINSKIIKCVGEPDKRFNEDALRILRALRFSSVTGFEIEKQTENAIFSNKNLLKNISAERVYVEITKMLCGKNVKNVITRYIDVLGVIIPELIYMKDFEQKNPHHIHDVLTHTTVVVESIENKPYLKYAALFHDIGKPKTFSIDENGIGHFYGHAKESTTIAEDILKRLKADNDTIDMVANLIKYHDTPIEISDISIKRKLNKLGSWLFFDLLKLMRADNLGQHSDFFHRQKEYDEIEKIAIDILNKKECFSLKSLNIDGYDLISLGVKPGKTIGEILNALLDMVIEGLINNDKEELLNHAKLLINKVL